MLRNVNDELYLDRTARIFAEWAIQRIPRKKQIEYCREHNLDPESDTEQRLEGPTFFPCSTYTLCGDYLNAGEFLAHSKPKPEAKRWCELPRTDRFALWTRELGYLRLPHVLSTLADALDERAMQELELEVLQGTGGLQLGLTRQLLCYVIGRFERPYFDKEIAAVISAVLDREVDVDYVGPERRRLIRISQKSALSRGDHRSY